jgi:flagellar secretion chaperone FliS
MSFAAEYLEAQVLTASPYRLHLLVIDGALRFARQALQAHTQQRWEDFDRWLARSRDCVMELVAGLDPAQSADVTASTKSLLLFVYRELALFGFSHDLQHLHSAVRILTRHRETWVALGQELRDGTPGEAVPQRSTETMAPGTVSAFAATSVMEPSASAVPAPKSVNAFTDSAAPVLRSGRSWVT